MLILLLWLLVGKQADNMPDSYSHLWIFATLGGANVLLTSETLEQCHVVTPREKCKIKNTYKFIVY